MIALVLAGCTPRARSPAESGIDWQRLAAQPLELPAQRCPYVSLYVDRPAFAYFDSALAEQAASRFAAAMASRGFEVVDRRPDAYFVAKSVVQRSFNRTGAPNWVVWWLKVEAQLELRDMLGLGVHPRPSVDDRIPMTLSYRKPDAEPEQAEYGSTSLLVDLPDSEIAMATEYAATAIALDLLPHIERKCSDFESRREEREVEVERIRETLAAEMERVRRARTRQDQQRRLDLEVESEPADRGDP